MENLLDKFLSFANTSYSMFDVKSKVKDDRKSPQISPSVIETYHLQPLRSYLTTIYTKARHNGKCKVDGGR